MRERAAPRPRDRSAGRTSRPPLRQSSDLERPLERLGITAFKVNPNPVMVATEGALCRSVKALSVKAMALLRLGVRPDVL